MKDSKTKKKNKVAGEATTAAELLAGMDEYAPPPMLETPGVELDAAGVIVSLDLYRARRFVQGRSDV